jgi:hypothetical protein
MGNTFAADFKAAHPEELGPDGRIKVCVGGGAGFIGSHIAKRLMEEVRIHGHRRIFFSSYFSSRPL